MAEITQGAVQRLNLAAEATLWCTVDWGLCLEVAERVSARFTDTLLRNLGRHL